MSWNGSTGFLYNEQSIINNAPAGSGVYAIYRENQWIYIGESGNVRDRLLEHIRRQENPCIVRSNPTHFAYELVAAPYRVQRQDQLIAEFHPSCNQRFG
jgi:excinuclease UvrABC nuclease subunit